MTLHHFTLPKQSLSEKRFPLQAPLFVTLLGAAFLVGYWPALQKLLMRWDSGDNSYCFLVVPIFFYLCWEKRDSFRFFEFSWSPWGLLPTLLALGLVAVGELGSMETLVYLGLWGSVLGVFTLLYGRRLRLLAFPFLILLFIVPLPPYINNVLTFRLKMIASSASVQMLQAVGVSVLQEGNIIDLGVEKLQVVDACSGLRYIMPMVLLALLIGHLFVKGWWRRAILLALVLPLAIIVNGLRIFITALLTVHGHPELAHNFFHDFAGLAIFLVGGGFLFALALLLNRVGPLRYPAFLPDPGGRPVKFTVPTLFVFIYCALFIGSGWALQRLPGTQTIPARTSFDRFPMEIGAWHGRKNFLAEEILNQLWADDYVEATYLNDNKPGQRIYLLIPYYEYQGTRHTAHAPQSCLLGGGWAMLDSREQAVTVANGRTIPVRTMVLEKGGHRLLGSYFFLNRGRVITNPWLNKFYLVWDAFTKRRTDGALIRVEMSVPPGQSMEKAHGDLEKFIAKLWGILPSYIPS